jgi:hypothetical protein
VTSAPGRKKNLADITENIDVIAIGSHAMDFIDVGDKMFFHAGKDKGLEILRCQKPRYIDQFGT